MQKIVIKNFGPIKYADIAISKVVLLIGEQASGKSTIAKLIYFFKVLSDRVFERFYKSGDDSFSIPEHIVFPTRDEFYALFGSTRHLPDFEVTYYYNFEQGRYIRLNLGERKELLVQLSRGFITRDQFREFEALQADKISLQAKLDTVGSSREDIVFIEELFQIVRNISSLINILFHNIQNTQHYIIAGRESSVSYQSAFEMYMDKVLTEISEDNRKKTDRDRIQAVDEILMLEFLKESRREREIIKRFGGKFSSVISNWSVEKNGSSLSQDIAKIILEKEKSILKGGYDYDGLGEKIRLSSENYVNLKDASSGQKESIRILQHILISILEKQKFFTVVEEPEAHLFPMAQKALMELLILMANHMPESQLLITTHSPYVLTIVNNLLFASRVIEKNKAVEAEVNQVVEKAFRIDPTQFSAYSLGNNFFPESAYCESIFNEKTGVIKQNYLDTISELLGADFNQLYSLHAHSFSTPQV